MRVTTYVLWGFLLACFSLTGGRAESAARIIDDKLGASLIKISVPQRWNKNVLILAHGLRDPSQPLSADFTSDKGWLKTLSDDGWLIASTSYRRNGYITHEAIEDLEELRRDVAERFGKPEKVILYGASMGGAIVTLMAEANHGSYVGAIAEGPALGMNRNTYQFTPAMPLLMLTNQDERADPDRYLKRVGAASVRPALWVVKRNGHCNITSSESLAALRALVRWSDGGPIELEKDATITPEAPASVAVFTGEFAAAKVVRCAASRGSCDTEFTAADMEKLGIRSGAAFGVTSHGKSFAVHYGHGYFDVPKGNWIAFILAETGRLRIGRNNADAITPLACAVGDVLSIGRATDKEPILAAP